MKTSTEQTFLLIYVLLQIMAERIRYAMYNCVEMDADFRLAENEMTGWDFVL